MIYKNVVECDLRQLKTAEDFAEIEKFENVVELLLPKNLSDEARSALAKIPRENVVKEIYLDPDDELRKINGFGIIDRRSLGNSSHKVYYTVNGFAVVCDVEPGTVINFLSVNGFLLIQKNTDVVCNGETVNGTVHEAVFNPENVKWFSNTITVNSDFLKELPKNSFVVAGDSIVVEDDVSLEDLKSSGVRFLAGDDMKAPKDLLGFLQTISDVGDNFVATRSLKRIFRKRR